MSNNDGRQILNLAELKAEFMASAEFIGHEVRWLERRMAVLHEIKRNGNSHHDGRQVHTLAEIKMGFNAEDLSKVFSLDELVEFFGAEGVKSSIAPMDMVTEFGLKQTVRLLTLDEIVEAFFVDELMDIFDRYGVGRRISTRQIEVASALAWIRLAFTPEEVGEETWAGRRSVNERNQAEVEKLEEIK